MIPASSEEPVGLCYEVPVEKSVKQMCSTHIKGKHKENEEIDHWYHDQKVSIPG